MANEPSDNVQAVLDAFNKCDVGEKETAVSFCMQGYANAVPPQPAYKDTLTAAMEAIGATADQIASCQSACDSVCSALTSLDSAMNAVVKG